MSTDSKTRSREYFDRQARDQACVDCGEKICNNGTEYLCARCYFTIQKSWNYDDISDLDFLMPTTIQENL